MCDHLLKHLFCVIIPVVCLVGLGIGLGYYFANPERDVEDIEWPTLEDFYTEDPYNATAPQDTDRWANDGQGLSLEVLNALESNWYSYFDAAILDWSSGSPSTLNLTTAVIPHESDCWPVTGKLKVCNGNYGATKWRGINQALIEDGFIVSSSAKMNEYYLSQASNDRKQYTMCHEIGHGFGLPHTDESFWNRDLGNCMDYSHNPTANMHPDYTNYEFLADLYGELPGSSSSTYTSSSNNNDNVKQNNNNNQNQKQDSDGEGSTSDSNPTIPSWVSSAWEDINQQFHNYIDGSNSEGDNTTDNDEDNQSGVYSPGDGENERRYIRRTLLKSWPNSRIRDWQILHESRYARVHMIDIGEGYSIRVRELRAD